MIDLHQRPVKMEVEHLRPVAHGPEIAPDQPGAVRDDYGQVMLDRRLRQGPDAERIVGRCI